MNYRVIEKESSTGVKKYRIHEKDPESKEWLEIVNEVDSPLEFTDLERAKQFVDYLREMTDYAEKSENVVYEV